MPRLLNDLLRRLRETKFPDKSMQHAADAVGIDRTLLAKYENGRLKAPPAEVAEKLVDLYECTPELRRVVLTLADNGGVFPEVGGYDMGLSATGDDQVVAAVHEYGLAHGLPCRTVLYGTMDCPARGYLKDHPAADFQFFVYPWAVVCCYVRSYPWAEKVLAEFFATAGQPGQERWHLCDPFIGVGHDDSIPRGITHIGDILCYEHAGPRVFRVSAVDGIVDGAKTEVKRAAKTAYPAEVVAAFHTALEGMQHIGDVFPSPSRQSMLRFNLKA